MKKYSLTLLLITTLIITSCDSTEPDEKTKSVRDYEWTVDTIAYQGDSQTLMYSVYGPTADYLFTCGISSSYNSLYYFDGNAWSLQMDKLFETVNVDNFTYTSIHGTSSNNIWAVGYKSQYNEIEQFTVRKGFITQYNGLNWQEHDVDTHSLIIDVYVENESNVWACGYDGIVYHYDGAVWDLDTMQIELVENGQFQLTEIIYINGTTYTHGVQLKPEGPELYLFIKEGSDDWEIANQHIINWLDAAITWKNETFHKSTDNKLWKADEGGVFEWNGNSWSNIHNLLGTYRNMSIYSSNDMISVGSFGLAKHYDGSSWEDLSISGTESIHFWDVIQFKDEAFLIGLETNTTPQITLVFHGK